MVHNNRFYIVAGDIFGFLLAYAIGGYLFWEIRHSEDLFIHFWPWALVFWVIIPFGIGWFYLKGHYTRRWPFWDEARGIYQVLLSIAILDGALIFLTKSTFSRIWFSATFLSLFIFIPLCRWSVKRILLSLGKWQLVTIIIGTGENALDVLRAVQSERMMGFDVRVFLSKLPFKDAAIANVPVEVLEENLEEQLTRFGVQCIIYAPENDQVNGNKDLLERLHRFTQHLYLVPAMRGVPLHGLEIHFFFRHEVIMMRVRNNLLRPIVRFFKRGFDIIGAFVLLCLLSPFFLLIIFLVRRDGGPAFYGHERVGLKGKPFKCLKFRSMVPEANKVLDKVLSEDPAAKAEWEENFKLKNDPRVTALGNFLRNSSLDELPQLWNVLKGEMSLVGPRPLVAEELERYGAQVDYYLHVRPGMTGLWQVSGRNDVDYSHRVYLDVWYVKNWSLWYDIAILMKTFKVVLNKQGAY